MRGFGWYLYQTPSTTGLLQSSIPTISTGLGRHKHVSHETILQHHRSGAQVKRITGYKAHMSCFVRNASPSLNAKMSDMSLSLAMPELSDVLEAEVLRMGNF